MWKYIIIAAVVLFLGACFLFYKNNEALTGPEGEVAAFQAQFDMAKKKAVDIEKDQAVKRYAELRNAYFKQQSDKYNEERTALDAEDAPLVQEIAKATADLDAAKADFKRYQEQFKSFQKDATQAAGVEDADDEESLKLVGQRIAELVETNNALEAQAAAEEKMTQDLGAESERTLAMIEAAKQLAADRLARLSPVELKCSVASVDPTWDYVILDSGIDKGIVIGSRLAVMRGEQKVCELTVTLVESSKASCDVVYSTMRPGDKVQPGDTVVSVRNN
ncbi:MAG: hypothetical protein IKY92_04220 [Akkermansia sp.]|nr:hypothetical protein [Akkermansia sp.]